MRWARSFTVLLEALSSASSPNRTSANPPSAAALAKSVSDIMVAVDLVLAVDLALSEGGAALAARAARPAQTTAKEMAAAAYFDCLVMVQSSCVLGGAGFVSWQVGMGHVCLHRQDTPLALYIVRRYTMSSAARAGGQPAEPAWLLLHRKAIYSSEGPVAVSQSDDLKRRTES